MAEARDIVAKALAERAKAGIKVRQPLATLSVKKKLGKELLSIVAEEVNVKEVKGGAELFQELMLNTEITPTLMREGRVREIMRHVQEMRKQAGYKPQDRIKLRYEGEAALKEVLKENQAMIMNAVGLKEMTEGDRPKQVFDVEQEFFLDGQPQTES